VAAPADASIAAPLRTSGGKRRARAFDALIAATASVNDLPLHTGNPSDFDGVPRLRLGALPAPVDS